MDNRRIAPRLRTVLTGTVVFDDRKIAVSCNIRDISETGARIAFGALVSIPDEFTLEIPSKRRRHSAQAMWRRGLEMGVVFRDGTG